MSAVASQSSKTAKPSSTTRPEKSPLYLTVGAVTLLAVAILAVYWPALRGGFVLDDEDMLSRCGMLGWQQIWWSTVLPDYWPVTESVCHVEWNVWGYSTLGYHVVNLALHFGAALMIWRILKRLALPGAFIAALLFAIHPVNVESVAWLAQLKNTLSMFWFLASGYFYLRQDQPSSRRNVFYALSLSFFVLALLSKIGVVVLPPLLLLITWWKRPLTKRDLIRVTPFFVVAVILTAVNIWFMSHANPEGIRASTWVQRVLGAGAVTWFYLWKALLPIDLAFIYPKWDINVHSGIWYLPLVAAIVATGALWRVRNNKTGRALFVGWLFFVIALGPVMGLSDTGFMKFSLVADHYQHIAIIAVLTLVAAALTKLTNYKAQVAVVALIAVALSAKAMQQATIYRDAVTLYRAAVEKNPTSWILHGNLADELLKAGQLEPAMVEFRETLKLNPDSDDAHYFYGEALLQAGAIEDATTQFNEVTKIPRERYHFKAFHRLAMISLAHGDKPQARVYEENSQDVARRYGLDQFVAQSEEWLKSAGLK